MTTLPDFAHLLRSRERLDELTKDLQRELREIDDERQALTRQLAQKCFYDGHDWKQDCVSFGAGHYWSCRVCYSAAPGRHYDKPDPWFSIPRPLRKRKPGEQIHVRVYQNGEIQILK